MLGLLSSSCGTGTARWVTTLEVTSRRLGAAPTDRTCCTPRSPDARRGPFLPYIGDYIRLLAVGNDFYGVFSGTNMPDRANFPSGVRYQRNADCANRRLLGNDSVTPVAVSIDPFFVHYAEPDNLPWASCCR